MSRIIWYGAGKNLRYYEKDLYQKLVTRSLLLTEILRNTEVYILLRMVQNVR